jgi:uncharacterized protein YbdZ (MbtH family)
LPELFFDPEDGSDKFFRNVDQFSMHYTVLYPRRQKSSLWRRDKLVPAGN